MTVIAITINLIPPPKSMSNFSLMPKSCIAAIIESAIDVARSMIFIGI